MKSNFKLSIILLVVFYNLLSAQGTSEPFFKMTDDFFKKFVVKGRVDYSSLNDNPSNLGNLIEMISSFDLSELPQGKEEKALLINVYNLLVINAVLNERATYYTGIINFLYGLSPNLPRSGKTVPYLLFITSTGLV